jgi:transketolase
MADQKNYKQLSIEARKKVLEMVHKGKTSHIASNFSVIDIATVLYENLKEGDEVVWSKGWVAATIYYFLAKQGKIPVEDLEKFPNEPYFGLAETTIPGVHVSGGSMGHGLPVAVGMALGKKRSGEKGTVYCIMSDGELNEGTTWESAAVAAQHKLDNLVVFVDKNNWQAMGKTEEVLNINPAQAFRGFGWNSWLINGHDFEEIETVILKPVVETVPNVIVAETIKGKGVSFFEDHLLYHYKHVEADEYERALKELV